MLLEENFLLADVTLPHGVFKPYASVKTHILVVDRVLARRCDSVLFVEIENDGFTQSDTREAIPGSQLPAAAELILQYKRAKTEGVSWEQPNNSVVRAYMITKTALLEDPRSHLLGRWHDLPNRVVHRDDVSLKRLGDLCDIRDGLSPNMATPPGEFVLVVPAEERKTADHWDYEGKAICIPLVSSAGHGKADIKRIHYQEGRFALATTMCASFVKDTTEVNPRYLHLFLSAECDDLLVPLMCGATNVTLDSNQLSDVLVPIPEPSIQDEIVESNLIRTHAVEMLSSAKKLSQISTNPIVISRTDRVIKDLADILQAAANKVTIEGFLPKR